MCGRLRVGKSFLHVCSLGRCSHVFGLLVRHTWPLAITLRNPIKCFDWAAIAADAFHFLRQPSRIKSLLTMFSYWISGGLLRIPHRLINFWCGKTGVTTMSTLSISKTPNDLASQSPVNSRGLRMGEVIPHLVGHTLNEVERELILHTLTHYCGSRTRSASVLGISIRCMRNKIHEYEFLGIAVAAPGEPRIPVGH